MLSFSLGLGSKLGFALRLTLFITFLTSDDFDLLCRLLDLLPVDDKILILIFQYDFTLVVQNYGSILGDSVDLHLKILLLLSFVLSQLFFRPSVLNFGNFMLGGCRVLVRYMNRTSCLSCCGVFFVRQDNGLLMTERADFLLQAEVLQFTSPVYETTTAASIYLSYEEAV